MSAIGGLRHRLWPRARAFERIGLGALLLSASVIVSPLVTRDPNLRVYGGVGLLIAVGLFVGVAVDTKRDAFAAGFFPGLGGTWFGLLVYAPLWYLLGQPADATGFFLAMGLGFGLGLVFGGLAGAICGLAALVTAAVSTARRPGAPG